MKKIFIIVFLIGGISYGNMELLFRGYTHWSMVMAAGLVFTTVFIFMESLLNISIFASAFIIASTITIYEYYYGLILNLKFNWHIWNYSNLMFNLNGQICPCFFFIWYILSLFFICLNHFLIGNSNEKATIKLKDNV